MDLNQLRHFVRVVELGSVERAAHDLGMGSEELSGELEALQTSISVSLLQTAEGIQVPSAAGLAFFREAQLALKHLKQAAELAQMPQLTGTVRVGLTPTICSVLGLPILFETRKRYPGLRLHIVESMSGHLAEMLSAQQLDMAVLCDTQAKQSWQISPLLDESLLLIQSARQPVVAQLAPKVSLNELGEVPLLLPSRAHSLRISLHVAFNRAHARYCLAAEIDSLAMLMDAVDAGIGATIQPWSAIRRFPDAADRFQIAEILNRDACRHTSLCSLPNNDMSAAAVAVRLLLAVCARHQIGSGAWFGARLRDH